MGECIQIEFSNISSRQNEMLIAALADAGFTGFEENENALKAFIKAEDFEEDIVNKIAGQLRLVFTTLVIKEENWNQAWEANFHPVIVDDFCAVRADFHKPVSNVQHEIIITPKMSFGTGHHPTTYMMICQMKQIEFKGKQVFDFGTGTGILAILAEKMGAANILAIDHDEWSIANAEENFLKNNCGKVQLEKASAILHSNFFDIILANINKNVIIGNINSITKQLKNNGSIIMSGLLYDDWQDIANIASANGLSLVQSLQKENWICLTFILHRLPEG